MVIECAGLELTLNQAVEVAKPVRGRLIIVALYEDKPNADINQLVAKNINLVGVLGYSEDDFKQALQLIAEDKADRKVLIVQRYDLAQAADAFEAQVNTVET